MNQNQPIRQAPAAAKAKAGRQGEKGFSAVALIIIVGILVFAGAFGVRYFTKKTDETANWETYVNTKFGYTLQYPPPSKNLAFEDGFVGLNYKSFIAQGGKLTYEQFYEKEIEETEEIKISIPEQNVANSHFDVFVISADSLTEAQAKQSTTQILDAYAEQIWAFNKERNKENQYAPTDRLVTDLKRVSLDGRPAYSFSASWGFAVPFPRGGYRGYIFEKSDNVHNFIITIDDQKNVFILDFSDGYKTTEQILGTFKFTK